MAIGKLLKFGIKAGIVGGTVFYTIDEGLWGDSESAIKFYEKHYRLAEPYIKEVSAEVPISVPPLPHSEEIGYTVRRYWNCGVKQSFTFLRDLPDTVSTYSKKGIAAAYEKLVELNSSSTADNTKVEQQK